MELHCYTVYSTGAMLQVDVIHSYVWAPLLFCGLCQLAYDDPIAISFQLSIIHYRHNVAGLLKTYPEVKFRLQSYLYLKNTQTR